MNNITLPNIIHNEIYACCLEENVLHAYEEGMIDLEQYALLDVNVLYGVQLYHHVLTDAFHCIELLRLLISY